MNDANRKRACAFVRDLGLVLAALALASACGAAAPGAPASSAAPSGGKGGESVSRTPDGAAPGGEDPATTPMDAESRAQRMQKADDCLKKCYQSPAAISGDALRDMCEKQCGSTGSGKVQPSSK